MKSFIFDYTGKKAIRISHISTVEVVDGELNSESDTMTRYSNVQCIVRGNTYTLAKGFKYESFAIEWMKCLGFIKGKKDDPLNY